MNIRLSAALLGCLITPVSGSAADLYASVGIDLGWAKQEMQGLGPESGQGRGPEPHFSLSTQSRDYSVEIGRQHALDVAGQPVDLGIAFIHSGPQTVDASQSPHQWIAQTGRLATVEAASILLIARTPLAQSDAGRIEAAAGVGFAATTLRLADHTQRQTTHQTVPQGLVALRGVRAVAEDTDMWIEARYLTSPALKVDFGDDRVIGHETSGWSIGIGLTIALK